MEINSFSKIYQVKRSLFVETYKDLINLKIKNLKESLPQEELNFINQVFNPQGKKYNDVDSAIRNFKKRIPIIDAGRVEKIFPDDLNGSQHQLFYLRTLSGYLVKVAHNVSLAARIPNLKKGLFLALKGEFKDRDSLKDKSCPVFKFNEDPAIIGLIHYTHKSANHNFKEDGGIIILEKGTYYHQIMR